MVGVQLQGCSPPTHFSLSVLVLGTLIGYLYVGVSCKWNLFCLSPTAFGACHPLQQAGTSGITDPAADRQERVGWLQVN